jgi:hypothetical protein
MSEREAVEVALAEVERRLREVFGRACSEPCPHVGCQAQHITADVAALAATAPDGPTVADVVAAVEAIYPPYNYELRYDGSEDPVAAAYVDAFREVDNVLGKFRAPTAAEDRA